MQPQTVSRRYKRRASEMGVVIQDSLEATGRTAFFQIDPDILEQIDARTLQEVLPSSTYSEFNPLDYLQYLPELEAEIFWMISARGKGQHDVAKLLGVSQPTVSYRFRRVVEKIGYLAVLTALDVRGVVSSLEFLTEAEQDVLYDLFFYVNQEAVGKIHGKRQSSVKWIALKTRSTLEKLEPEDPERWSNALGMVYLLFRNLGIRIRSE